MDVVSILFSGGDVMVRHMCGSVFVSLEEILGVLDMKRLVAEIQAMRMEGYIQ